jgi:hypothetical protein
MAKTCTFIDVTHRPILAPTPDGQAEIVPDRRHYEGTYRMAFDFRSWKKNRRARRQWQRHK